MEEFKKISSNEWGTPYKGASTDALSDIAQRHRGEDKPITVASILAEDEEKQIQGVDIHDEK